jgi:hypothetical protein
MIVVNRCWLCESDEVSVDHCLVERHFQPFWFVLGYA